MKEFRLPDPGEGLVEAEIVNWRVQVGDEVKINDIVVEVETSKSLVELPIPYAGVVAALLVSEGETVDVGVPIIVIDDGTQAQGTAKEDLVPAIPEPDEDVASASPDGRVANLVGYGPRTTEAKRRPRKGAAAATHEARAGVAQTFSTAHPVSRHADVRTPLAPSVAEPIGAPLPSPGQAASEPTTLAGPVLAKPPVRKLAKDLGVDLATVSGTGAGGVVTRDDVTRAANGAATESAAPTVAAVAAPTGQDTRVPIKGVRKVTAEAMVSSAFTAPHVTEWVTVDVSATMDLLEQLKSRREFKGIRVSPLLLVAKATCLALARTPYLNSRWDGANDEIVLKGAINLGIAAATPRGLMVPNIKGAGSMSLLELAGAINDLVSTAKDGKTQPADMSQGTFTITNVGVFGVDAGTPILNPGEAGILCVGSIDRRPWVVGTGPDERIEPRWVTTLSVSFDHRIVDGEQGSQFLADVAAILRDPGLALLF